MPNLRFLKSYSSSYEVSNHVHLPKGLEFLSHKIRYLEWYGYPLKFLPSTFCPEKLVELCMPNSQTEKLWEGVQDLVNLKMINLSESRVLIELPDFSKAFNLEIVRLEGCESLQYVHSSILSLHSLVELVLIGCKKLKSLKSEILLRSLEYLDVEDCLNLKELSVSSEKISELNLSKTEIEILDSSTGCSRNLAELYLNGIRLKNLPNELSCLRAMTKLNLSNCEVIDNSKLEILLDGLSFLRELELEYCSEITEVPDNIRHLSWLETLSLKYCKRLCVLPKLPPSIRILHVDDCESLETVMASRPQNESSEIISFENCVKLNDQSLHNIIEDVHSAMIGAAYDYHWSYSLISLPGSKVPEWFKYRTTQSSIVIELLPPSHLLDFAFCIVVQCASPTRLPYLRLNCTFYMGDFKVRNFIMPSHLPEMNSDHVYMWHNRLDSNETMMEIERKANDQFITNLKVAFKFGLEAYEEISKPCLTGITIKECGVWPIYVSEYVEFIRQRELNNNNKRPRDVDEEEPLPQFKKLKLDFGLQTNTRQDIDAMVGLLMRMDII